MKAAQRAELRQMDAALSGILAAREQLEVRLESDEQMTFNSLAQLIARHPKAQAFRRSVADRVRSSHPDELESFCIDHLTEDFVVLCFVFFQHSPSATAPVKSILSNDLFVVAVLFLEALHRSWLAPGRSTDEQITCVETVSDLLLTVGAKQDEPQGTVQGEMVAAYLLCQALANQRKGAALLEGPPYEFLVADELYASLSADATLAEIASRVRRRFF